MEVAEDRVEGKRGFFPLNHLGGFFGMPASVRCKKGLSLTEEEEDLTRRIHEPVSLEPLDEWQLPQENI
ncbi:MAG: hypothetical protein Ct9H90mP9_2070 [Pseudomonadota bacterium]|nr:MAG: hypothetical protein Ct9H90mP9_2070 [Pseudomonadota bacterium]